MNPVLTDNLQEIYYASRKTPQGTPLPLVANYWGTRVYVASRGWGKLWCWFYDLVEFFYGTSERAANLKTSIQKTHELFQQVSKNYQSFIQTYKSHLNLKLKREDTRTLLAAKNAICEWQQSIMPFVKKMKNAPDERLLQLLEKRVSDTENAQTAPFTSPEAKTLSYCFKAIQFENAFPDLPFRTLMAAGAPDETLQEAEEFNIVRLRDQLNAKGNVEIVRKGLKGMVALWNEGRNEKIDALKIHAFLFLNECTIYSQAEDIKTTFLPGETVVFNDKTLTIDQHHSTSTDGHQVKAYTLQENPDKFLLVGKNKLHFHIRQIQEKIQEQTDQRSQFSAKLLEVSKNGRFALMKRAPLLSDLLKEPWKTKSNPNNAIDGDDRPLAKAIAALIKKCLTIDKIPNNLKTLPWLVIDTKVDIEDETGASFTSVLKSLSPVKLAASPQVTVKRLISMDPTTCKPFSTVEIHAFISACAAGNGIIRLFLVKESTLEAREMVS